MNHQALYNEKLKTAEEAVQYIQPETDLMTPILCGEPDALIKQLENYDGLNNNRYYMMFTPREVIDVDPDRLKVISMFMGASERQAFKEGRIDLLPNHFSDVPNLLKQEARKPVVLATVSPMDENGYFSMGTNADHIISMVKEADTILLEVNKYMPRTFGDNQIHISEVTALIEHHQPLPEAPESKLSEKDQIIGDHVASLIKNGDTLQIGYGSIPNAIIDNLKDYRNLSVHTEMIPEKIIELYKKWCSDQ